MAKRIMALGEIFHTSHSLKKLAVAADKLEGDANAARLLSIMYRKHRTIAILDNIKSLLDGIRHDEKNLLAHVLAALS